MIWYHTILLGKDFNMFQTTKLHLINIFFQFLSYISNMNAEYHVKKSQEGIELYCLPL